MKATSFKGSSPFEISTKVDQHTAEGFRATLALVFMPSNLDIPAVSQVFDERSISVFGASSFGNFIDKDFDRESIVVMLLDADPAAYRLIFKETGDYTTAEIARSIGTEGKAAFSKPAFIIVSGGIKTDGEVIVGSVLEGAGGASAIFGGLAASDYDLMKTIVFDGKNATDDGILALVFDEERISVKGLAIGGWKPVGMFRTITKSEGNMVHSIDHLPALDTVLRYSGTTIDQLKNERDVLRLASAFQVQLHREDASPIMRTPMFANLEDKSIVFAGTIPQGSKVKFSLLPGFEVIENLITEYKQYHEDVPSADAMILFSCQGREIALGPWVGEEIERVQQIWNAPLAGFFTFGEIGLDKNGTCEFYNMSCSLVLLHEL